MPVEFKYRNGARLFFTGKNAKAPDRGFYSLSPDRIYECLVVACRLEVINTAPKDLVPVNRTVETYTVQVGEQKEVFEVLAEHLRENSAELLPLTITYLYNAL